MSHKYPPFIEAIEGTDPVLSTAVKNVLDLANAPGELDAKTKVLITLALDVYANSTAGVKSLSSKARALGATEGEIAEAIRIAYMVSGMKTLFTSRSAYDTEE